MKVFYKNFRVTKGQKTYFLKYGNLTVHFNRNTQVFLKWKHFRTDFGTRMYLFASPGYREECSG